MIARAAGDAGRDPPAARRAPPAMRGRAARPRPACCGVGLGGAGGRLHRRRRLLELPGPARRAGRAARARRRAAAPSCRSSTASRSSTRARTATPPTSCSAPTPTCRWSSSPTPTSRRTRRSRSTPATPTARSTSTPSRAATLDRFPYVITGRAAWNSQAPPSFRRIAATPSYVLWERTGAAPARPPRAARGDRAGGARRLRLAGDPHPRSPTRAAPRSSPAR